MAYGRGDAAAAVEALERLESHDRRGGGRRGAGPAAIFGLALVVLAAPHGVAQDAPGPAGADPKARWEAANRAYREGDFRRAAETYAELAARTADPRLEADLGAALWRAGEEGAAVAAYLRALELEPRAWRVRADLEALRARLGDPPAASRPIEGVLGWVRLDEWLALLLGLSWAAFVAVLLAGRGTRAGAAARPAAPILVGAFAIVALAAAVNAATAPGRRAVAAGNVPIAARPGGDPIGTLPEGAVAEVLETEAGAWRVRVPGVPAGWVASDRIVPLD